MAEFITLIISMSMLLASLAAPMAPAVPDTARDPAPVIEATEVPWTGNGHWYTFQYVDSGLVDSVGHHYGFLDLPYFIPYDDGGIALGKLKGAPTDIRLYTMDPEERVIWARSEDFWATFVLTGTELPVPGPDNADLEISNDLAAFVPSEEAQAELRALIAELERAGKAIPILLPDLGTTIAYTFHDMPWLGYWPFLTIEWIQGSPALVSWKPDPQGGIEPQRYVKIDTAGRLFAEYAELEQFTP